METVDGAIWRRGADIICEMHNQGISVDHHDRARAISYITKSGTVQGKSWTNQTLSDAWESTIREDLCGNPWYRRLHTAIAEIKLMMKFIADEEGTDLLLPR